MLKTEKKKLVRKRRVRYKLSKVRGDRLRLAVHRTGKHTYAQVIDDDKGETLFSASTLEKEVKALISHGANREAAGVVGKRIADKAVAANISSVVFDRGGHIFHGRVQALAEAAKENGLNF